MSTQVQYRRGSNVQVAAFTGALGEIVVDTTNKVLVVNDGTTVGGFPQVGLTATQTITNKVYNGTSLSVTGNVDSGNLRTSGLVSATGNITSAANISGGNIAITSAASAASYSATGNITGGNLLTGGLISATGNITSAGNISGTYLLGNASFVTGLSASKIFNGTTEANIGSSGGNANISVGGTSNVAVFATTGVYVTGLVSASGNITAASNVAGGNVLATTTVSAASHIGATVSITGTMTAASTVGGVITGTSLSVSGNVTSASNIAGGNISITSAASAASYSASGTITGGTLISTGTISTAGNIVSTAANATANIGSATTYFNTVHAKATSAQYADVAEKYISDNVYLPGTVLEFGGNNEVTVSSTSHSTSVAGIVSTNPAYIMNAGATGETVVEVALLGRVPCKVVGTISKGDRIVASQLPGVAQALDSNMYRPGCIIGKALENYNSQQVGTIEVVVGRV